MPKSKMPSGVIKNKMATPTNLSELILSSLSAAKLKNTATRRTVLAVFYTVDYALNFNEINDAILPKMDKVTIYRNLKTFEEAGIIHQVLDNSGAVRYALCAHQCNHGHHHDAHIHFNCVQCEKTYCLDESKIPQLQLPQGYQMQEVALLVKGVCKSCVN